MLKSSCDGFVTHYFIKNKDNIFYSRITSTKSLSACMTTFSASLTNLTPLLPQSRDSSCYVSRPILAHPPLWLQEHADLYAHTTSRILRTCDVSLGSLTLPAPEAGEFVELILLYLHISGWSYWLELNLTEERYDNWVVKVLTLSSASLPKKPSEESASINPPPPLPTLMSQVALMVVRRR